MNILNFKTIVLLTFTYFGVSASYAGTPLDGCWKLIDITALNLSDTPPSGISSRKDFYSEDGKMYILYPNEKLTESVKGYNFSFDNAERTILKDDGSKIITPVTFDGNKNFTLHFTKAEKWSYTKMGDRRSCNKAIEPLSVSVVAMKDSAKQQSNLDIKYSQKDYSKLPLKKRIIGVWEVNDHFGVARYEAPPYGYSNELYILTENKLYVLSPGQTSLEEGKSVSYKLKQNKLIFGKDKNVKKMKISFNRWEHLVLSVEGKGISLKLITKDITKIPLIPTKIVNLLLKE